MALSTLIAVAATFLVVYIVFGLVGLFGWLWVKYVAKSPDRELVERLLDEINDEER